MAKTSGQKRALRCLLATPAAISTNLACGSAMAEMQIGVYGGMNTNFNSPVTLHKGALSDSRTVDWEGRSFQMPPYRGAQATYWLNANASWGVGIDYTHSKAYAALNFATDPVYRHLEFTDGNNLLLLNLLYRFGPLADGRLVPYLGVGGGVAIPHVEVKLKAFPGQDTWEYQFAGGAAQVLGGLEYRLNDAWSLTAEGKLSYAHLATELEGGGTLKTYLWSPQLVLGLSYRFGSRDGVWGAE
jgi:lipid A oxidase